MAEQKFVNEADDNDNKIHLMFVHGIPGVGKLTTSRCLTEKYLPSYKLLHNHLIMEPLKAFFEFATPPFVKLRELHWLQFLEEAFKYKLEQKSNYKMNGIVFTFPFEYSVSKQFLPNLMDLVNKYKNVNITFIELICEQSTLIKRITNPDREKNGKLTDIKMLTDYLSNGNFYSGHKYITQTLKQPNIQINTEAKSADQIAKEICQTLNIGNIQQENDKYAI